MNVMGQHYRHRGAQVLTLTGLDEHGEKIAAKAREAHKSPQEYVDALEPVWKDALAQLQLKADVFLRTTSAPHQKTVQEFLQRCYDNGDIYYGEHAGNYCVDCEEFLSLSQMDEHHNCLVHKRPTEKRTEANYYFRFTKYRLQLLELVKKGAICSQPRYQNELASLLENLDADLSISRPVSRTNWGIPLPFDTQHVTYVWFDALPNYVTGVGGPQAAAHSEFWKNCVHILGKDILKFHGAYWPAMLLSLGLPLPQLLVTGWLMADGHKMAKSSGRVLSLADLQPFGRDAYTNAVFRLSSIVDDFELSLKIVLERYNSDLANGVGNLCSRTISLIEKGCGGVIPALPSAQDCSDDERALRQRVGLLPSLVATAFDSFKPHEALQHIWVLIAECDRYIAIQKPWSLLPATPETRRRFDAVMAHCVMVLRVVGYTAAAFFPEKMTELLLALQEEPDDLSDTWQRLAQPERIASGKRIQGAPRLYQRIDIAAALRDGAGASAVAAPAAGGGGQPSAASISVSKKAANEAVTLKGEGTSGTVSIDDFARCEIRVGTVVRAEIVQGSEKLLNLRISLGELGEKTVFSGIRQWVKPEDIVNRRVLVVTNLAPRKMRFGTSEGMVLSANCADGSVKPLYVGEGFVEGAQLS